MSYTAHQIRTALKAAHTLLRLTPLLAVLLYAAPIAHAQQNKAAALNGKIWHVQSGQFVNLSHLMNTLKQSDVILLGEVHDQPVHHDRQTKIIAQFPNGPQTALLFEMVSRDKDNAFDIYRSRFPAGTLPDTAAGLDMLLDWQRSGWPHWSLYEPVFRAGLAHGMTLAGAELPHGLIADLHRDGMSALPPPLAADLRPFLDKSLPPALAARQLQDIKDSHCGFLPDSLLPRFSALQSLRNAAYAQRLVALSPGKKRLILITGNEHARRDLGVPHYLSPLKGRDDLKITSVGQLPTQDDKPQPGDYAAAYGADILPFDYVWFSPGRAQDHDPCAGLADAFKGSLRSDRAP